MKRLTFYGLFLCFNALPAQAQDKTVQTEKLVIYTPLKQFFEKHGTLKEIRFSKEWPTDSLELDMIERDSSLVPAFNHFHLAEESDRYFYLKRFEPFSIPQSLYEQWIDRKADLTHISGTIRKDSIFFTLRHTYFKRDEDEKIFIKIESKWGHPKGLHVLARELEAKLSCFNVPANDSTLQIKYLLERNGSLSFQKVEKENAESPYVQEVLNAVQESGSWIPFETGGFKARRYVELFIRINRDKTYTIAMQ